MHVQIDGPARELSHESIELLDDIRLGDVVRFARIDAKTLGIRVIPQALFDDVTRERYIVLAGPEPNSIVIQFLQPDSKVPFVTSIDDPAFNQPHERIEILDDMQIGDTVWIDRIDAKTLGIRVIPPEEIDRFNGDKYIADQGRAPHIIVFRPTSQKRQAKAQQPWWKIWRKA